MFSSSLIGKEFVVAGFSKHSVEVRVYGRDTAAFVPKATVLPRMLL
jgi:hypothetical protein